MALLTPGYWPDTFWPASYWQDVYWPDYALVAGLGVIIDPTIGSLTPVRTLVSATPVRTLMSVTPSRTIEEK